MPNLIKISNDQKDQSTLKFMLPNQLITVFYYNIKKIESGREKFNHQSNNSKPQSVLIHKYVYRS